MINYKIRSSTHKKNKRSNEIFKSTANQEGSEKNVA